MGQPSVLLELGRRLRSERERLDLTVASLARRAGVSRRYVTETEAGRANPSLLVLDRLAQALGLEVPDLLRGAPRLRPVERVALVGLRGAGKSSVGRILALELEVPFVELDHEVETVAGLSLAEIFDLHGATAFHRYEAQALERVLASGERLVLATGGSITEAPANFDRLLETCHTVWLQAEPEEHFQRVLGQGDHRPMRERPGALAELGALLAARRPNYERCKAVVRTSGLTPAAVAERVLRTLPPV